MELESFFSNCSPAEKNKGSFLEFRECFNYLTRESIMQRLYCCFPVGRVEIVWMNKEGEMLIDVEGRYRKISFKELGLMRKPDENSCY